MATARRIEEAQASQVWNAGDASADGSFCLICLAFKASGSVAKGCNQSFEKRASYLS